MYAHLNIPLTVCTMCVHALVDKSGVRKKSHFKCRVVLCRTNVPDMILLFSMYLEFIVSVSCVVLSYLSCVGVSVYVHDIILEDSFKIELILEFKTRLELILDLGELTSDVENVAGLDLHSTW